MPETEPGQQINMPVSQTDVAGRINQDIIRTRKSSLPSIAATEAAFVDGTNVVAEANRAGEQIDRRDRYLLTMDEIADIADRGAQSEWANMDRIRRREAHYGKSIFGKANAYLAGATFKMEGVEHEVLKRGEHPTRRESGDRKPEEPGRMGRLLDWAKLKLYDLTKPSGEYTAKSEAFRKGIKVLGKVASSTTLAYACAALLASGVGAPVAGVAAVGAGLGRAGFEAYRVIKGKERRNRIELEDQYDEFYNQIREYASDLLEKHASLRRENSEATGYDVFRDQRFVEGENGSVSYEGLISLMHDQSKRKIQVDSYAEGEEAETVDLVAKEQDLRKHERNAEFWSGATAFLGGMGLGWVQGVLVEGKNVAVEEGAKAAKAVREGFQAGNKSVSVDLDGDGIAHSIRQATEEVKKKLGDLYVYLKEPSRASMGKMIEAGGKMVSNPDSFTGGDVVQNGEHLHRVAEAGKSITQLAIDKINQAVEVAANSEAAKETAKVIAAQIKEYLAVGVGLLAQATARPVADMIYRPEEKAREQLKKEHAADKKEALEKPLGSGQFSEADSDSEARTGTLSIDEANAGRPLLFENAEELKGEVWGNQKLTQNDKLLALSNFTLISRGLTFPIQRNEMLSFLKFDGNGNNILVREGNIKIEIPDSRADIKRNFRVITIDEMRRVAEEKAAQAPELTKEKKPIEKPPPIVGDDDKDKKDRDREKKEDILSETVDVPLKEGVTFTKRNQKKLLLHIKTIVAKESSFVDDPEDMNETKSEINKMCAQLNAISSEIIDTERLEIGKRYKLDINSTDYDLQVQLVGGSVMFYVGKKDKLGSESRVILSAEQKADTGYRLVYWRETDGKMFDLLTGEKIGPLSVMNLSEFKVAISEFESELYQTGEASEETKGNVEKQLNLIASTNKEYMLLIGVGDEYSEKVQIGERTAKLNIGRDEKGQLFISFIFSPEGKKAIVIKWEDDEGEYPVAAE